MTSKIDVRKILFDHIKTLKNDSADETSCIDLTVMFYIPIFLALAASPIFYWYDPISVDQLSALISAFSIFAGLLISSLLLIYQIVETSPADKKATEDDPDHSVRMIVLREVFTNIAFAILVSSAIIIFLVAAILIENLKIDTALSSLIFGLSSNFILTFLMILKRLYLLVHSRFETN
jgi:hypothetical protein